MTLKQFMHGQLCTTIPFFPQLSENGTIYHKSAEIATLLIPLNAPWMKFCYCAKIFLFWKQAFPEPSYLLKKNCSSLNNGLFLKRISDSPFCRCGAIENALYFFLNCPQYAHQRADLIRTLSQHNYHRKSSCYFICGQHTVHPDKYSHIWSSYTNIFGTQRDFKPLPQN